MKFDVESLLNNTSNVKESDSDLVQNIFINGQNEQLIKSSPSLSSSSSNSNDLLDSFQDANGDDSSLNEIEHDFDEQIDEENEDNEDCDDEELDLESSQMHLSLNISSSSSCENIEGDDEHSLNDSSKINATNSTNNFNNVKKVTNTKINDWISKSKSKSKSRSIDVKKKHLVKPPYSYIALITMSILQSSKKDLL